MQTQVIRARVPTLPPKLVNPVFQSEDGLPKIGQAHHHSKLDLSSIALLNQDLNNNNNNNFDDRHNQSIRSGAAKDEHKISTDLGNVIKQKINQRSISARKVAVQAPPQTTKKRSEYTSLSKNPNNLRKDYFTIAMYPETTTLSPVPLARSPEPSAKSKQKSSKRLLLQQTLQVLAPRISKTRWQSYSEQLMGEEIAHRYNMMREYERTHYAKILSPSTHFPRSSRHQLLSEYLSQAASSMSKKAVLQQTIYKNRTREGTAASNIRPINNSQKITKTSTKDPTVWKDTAKSMNIVNITKKVPLKDCINPEILRLPDQKQFLRLMRAYNDIKILNEPATGVHYRAYIGKGNNSLLIKQCLKSRGVWMIVDAYDEDVNFVWTQTKHQRFMAKLPVRPTTAKKPAKLPTSATHKPIKPKTLVYHNRLKNQYPVLEQLESILGAQRLNQYLNTMTSISKKSSKKAIASLQMTEVLGMDAIQKQQNTVVYQNSTLIKLHNHVNEASSIGNKKGLFYYMTKYYSFLNRNPFQVVPETIHLPNEQIPQSPDKLKNLIPFPLPCILKPGECTNRGKGITVHTTWLSLYQAITKTSNSIHQNGTQRSHIIQRYVMPFLYQNRKFDIRVWVLWNGRQAWWYKEGYLRTSCKQFKIKSTNKYVHLTNDAVQKNSEDYGKYEQGNKLSFKEFQRYLDTKHPGLDFLGTAYEKMKEIARDVFAVAGSTMDRERMQFGYQLFGLDFMIDEKFKVWLIEANTNPCLQTSCSLLPRLVSNMVDNVLSVAVDPLFVGSKKKEGWPDNFRLQLIYDAGQETRDFLVENKLDQNQVRFQTDEDEYQEKLIQEITKC